LQQRETRRNHHFTLVPPDRLNNAFRREVQALDGNLPVTDRRTLDAMLWERIRSWLDYGSMFSIFAAMALLLASVGLNAVIGHSASQRTQEIGIRIITGAPDYRYRLKVITLELSLSADASRAAPGSFRR